MGHREILEALTGILAGFFAAMLSINIVVTALPVIVHHLGGDQIQYSWVLTGTLLANAATTPIWGKLADLVDKKRLIQLTLLIFIAGSVVAGAAPDMNWLIAGRVIQGIGVGGLGALSMAIMGAIIAPRERGRYAGYMGAVMATATAAGPLLGGLIVDTIGWRWTFWVGVPLAVLAMVVIAKTLRIVHVGRPVHIDWWGATVLALATCLLLVWVSFAGNPVYFAWLSWQSAAFLGSVVALAVLFLWLESRSVEPVMNLRIFRNRTTVLAIVASVSVAVLMFSLPAYLGLYFQNGRGLEPTQSGLLTLPLILGNLIGSVTTGQLITRYGRWKPYLVAGSVVAVAATAWLGLVDATTSYWLIGTKLLLVGLGLGMVIQNVVLAVQNTVTVMEIGASSAAVTFFRTVGGAIGNSVLGSLMAIQLLGAGTPGQVADTYANGSGALFALAAVIALPAVFAVSAIREVPLRRTV
ncbi:MFS transporter [Citricoccus sp. SGAir0253]|nr:MFS transporter [Citricoccus sp. SGAir0253]